MAQKELREYNGIGILSRHVTSQFEILNLACLSVYNYIPTHPAPALFPLPQRQSFKLRGGGERRPEVLSQLWMILSRAELPELLGLG